MRTLTYICVSNQTPLIRNLQRAFPALTTFLLSIFFAPYNTISIKCIVIYP